jgi:hypothetical protein
MILAWRQLSSGAPRAARARQRLATNRLVVCLHEKGVPRSGSWMSVSMQSPESGKTGCRKIADGQLVFYPLLLIHHGLSFFMRGPAVIGVACVAGSRVNAVDHNAEDLRMQRLEQLSGLSRRLPV